MKTTIDLIRHGEPLGGSRYRGSGVDDVLTEKGWQQMWDAVGNDCPWDVIISSPLKRCLEFSHALAKKYERPVEIIDDLKEVGFGTWEGRSKEEIKQEHPAEFESFYADPVHARPFGAENLQAFSDRVNRSYRQACDQYTGQHILIVAHAGVNRAIVARQLSAPLSAIYRLKIDNAGLTRLETIDTQHNLIFLNCRSLPKN